MLLTDGPGTGPELLPSPGQRVLLRGRLPLLGRGTKTRLGGRQPFTRGGGRTPRGSSVHTLLGPQPTAPAQRPEGGT